MEIFNLDLSRIPSLLGYQPGAPMIFSSGLFFFLFILFVLIYIPLRKYAYARIFYVTLFSLYFYYKSSGIWFLLLMFTASSDFCIGRLLSLSSNNLERKLLVALSLCVNLGMLGYFKYTNFLCQAFTGLGVEIGQIFGIEQLFFDKSNLLKLKRLSKLLGKVRK